MKKCLEVKDNVISVVTYFSVDSSVTSTLVLGTVQPVLYKGCVVYKIHDFENETYKTFMTLKCVKLYFSNTYAGQLKVILPNYSHPKVLINALTANYKEKISA